MKTGHVNVDAMLVSMSNLQFEEWIAYFQIEPFGDEWLRSAMLMTMIANANRDKDLKPEPFEVNDFLPISQEDVFEEDPEQSWKRNKEILSMMANKKKET